MSEPIDGLLHEFYRAISFEDGGCPDWNLIASLFSRHARITRITPEGIDYLDLQTFRDLAEELIEVGAFTSFFEREVARRTERYGKVIHVASAYETKVSPHAADYIERGINSLQLIFEDEGWKIVSLCWDDHAPFSNEGLQLVEAEGISHG